MLECLRPRHKPLWLETPSLSLKASSRSILATVSPEVLHTALSDNYQAACTALVGRLQERVDNKKTRQNTVNLLTSTIKAGAEEEGLRHCFRVVSPEREYLLQVTQPPTPPTHPTHSSLLRVKEVHLRVPSQPGVSFIIRRAAYAASARVSVPTAGTHPPTHPPTHYHIGLRVRGLGKLTQLLRALRFREIQLGYRLTKFLGCNFQGLLQGLQGMFGTSACQKHLSCWRLVCCSC